MDLKTGTCVQRYLTGWVVDAVYEDPDGTLWISNHSVSLEDPTRLSRFDRITEHFEHYPYPYPADLSAMLKDRRGALWIGSNSTPLGALRFDQTTGQFTTYRHDPDDPTSLSEDRVCSFLLDRSGLFWIGTVNGLSIIKPQLQQFALYQRSPSGTMTLTDNRVNGMYEDHDEYLWIGTNNGLNRLDRSSTAVILQCLP